MLAFAEYSCNGSVINPGTPFFSFDGIDGGGGVSGNQGGPPFILQPGIYQVQFKGLAALSTDGVHFGDVAGVFSVDMFLDNQHLGSFLLASNSVGRAMASGSQLVKVTNPNQRLGFGSSSFLPVIAASFNDCHMSILQLQ